MRRLVIFSPGHGEIGGAARRSRLLAGALADRGWQVFVVTRAGTLRRFVRTRSGGVTLFEVPGFNSRSLGGALFLACAIPLGLLWGRRATAFLALQLVSPTTAAAVCAGVLRRRFVCMTSTSGRLSEATLISGSRLASLRRRIVGRASWVVAQTELAKRELEDIIDPDRIVVIPNPIGEVSARDLNGRPHAFFSGRFSDEKDLFTLLTAWRSVAARNPDARLFLVGEGGRYRSVEQQLRGEVASDPILRRQVVFTGWVSDLDRFLGEVDVFVLPSLSEGMSNALLEACAHGRVVVASDIGPNRAVLGDAYPLLYRAGDPEALADALHTAFSDEASRASAREHIDKILPRFSVEAVTTDLERLLVGASDSSRN